MICRGASERLRRSDRRPIICRGVLSSAEIVPTGRGTIKRDQRGGISPAAEHLRSYHQRRTSANLCFCAARHRTGAEDLPELDRVGTCCRSSPRREDRPGQIIRGTCCRRSAGGVDLPGGTAAELPNISTDGTIKEISAPKISARLICGAARKKHPQKNASAEKLSIKE